MRSAEIEDYRGTDSVLESIKPVPPGSRRQDIEVGKKDYGANAV